MPIFESKLACIDVVELESGEKQAHSTPVDTGKT